MGCMLGDAWLRSLGEDELRRHTETHHAHLTHTCPCTAPYLYIILIPLVVFYIRVTEGRERVFAVQREQFHYLYMTNRIIR